MTMPRNTQTNEGGSPEQQCAGTEATMKVSLLPANWQCALESRTATTLVKSRTMGSHALTTRLVTRNVALI